VSTKGGATSADDAITRNITHANVVSPQSTNSKNASVRKRRKLASRNLLINDDLVEVITIPARGKGRSVSEISIHKEIDKAKVGQKIKRGAAERVIGDSRQDKENSPIMEVSKYNRKEEEERGEGEARGGSVNAGTIETFTFQGKEAGCSGPLEQASPSTHHRSVGMPEALDLEVGGCPNGLCCKMADCEEPKLSHISDKKRRRSDGGEKSDTSGSGRLSRSSRTSRCRGSQGNARGSTENERLFEDDLEEI